MLESLVCLACVLGVSSKPRQPKASYVKVPQVPEPPSCGLAELLTKPTLSWPFETTDVAEAQFVGLAATVVREAAHGAWAYVDANQDGHLGIEELSKAVSESWVTSKASKRFQPKAGSWPFLYALAEEFGTKDLSRSARLDVSAMEELVDKLLRSVKFLDERRALFDEVAGDGVGDEEGTFSRPLWEAWRSAHQNESSAWAACVEAHHHDINTVNIADGLGVEN
ncbi:unnamed protein product [Symbiodinium natans]|uniref:EF-hand domain-containing protein n=1 Tax=Symbiodinium natans TaxID=878477 RepID=A0A812IBY6_9DINO|nr:unnamed protein product [Symbiodinium natans]